MITRVCPVCRTGEIRARTAHALYKRACCSRACALAIAREVRANPPAPVVAARAELAAQISRALHIAAQASLDRGKYIRTLAEDAQTALRRRANLVRIASQAQRLARDVTWREPA